jgi:hypothetical protein
MVKFYLANNPPEVKYKNKEEEATDLVHVTEIKKFNL